MAARLIAVLLCSLSILAGAEEAAADRQQRQEKANALQAEAQALKKQADTLLESRQKDCASKFFVNACRNEAQAEHLTTIREVRRLESEGAALERAVRQEEAQEADLARQEKARQKEADLRVRQAETTTTRQADEAAVAARQADKERKAAEGAKRKAAEAEKQRQKEARHAAKVAKKKQQAAGQ
jgi:colicin import membrane protein